MKVLAIDIGTHWGWCFQDQVGRETGTEKFHDLATLNLDFTTLIQKYKPDIVVSCAPVRFYNTISKHCRFLGVLELVCQKYEVQYHEVSEKTCKAQIIGSGKAKKKDIAKRYKCKTEHENDACMFAEYVRLTFS